MRHNCAYLEGEGEAENNILREIFYCCILRKSKMNFKLSKSVEIPLTKYLLSKFYRTHQTQARTENREARFQSFPTSKI